MEKKMTKKEVINMMLAEEFIINKPVYSAFLKHELELLEKKASTKKSSKNQQENGSIKTILLQTLETVSGTVTEIQKSNSELANYSNQKISALLRQLIEEGKVTKATEKGKSIFSLV